MSFINYFLDGYFGQPNMHFFPLINAFEGVHSHRLT